VHFGHQRFCRVTRNLVGGHLAGIKTVCWLAFDDIMAQVDNGT
jgi:hypothetical protein